MKLPTICIEKLDDTTNVLKYNKCSNDHDEYKFNFISVKWILCTDFVEYSVNHMAAFGA